MLLQAALPAGSVMVCIGSGGNVVDVCPASGHVQPVTTVPQKRLACCRPSVVTSGAARRPALSAEKIRCARVEVDKASQPASNASLSLEFANVELAAQVISEPAIGVRIRVDVPFPDTADPPPLAHAPDLGRAPPVA